MVHNLRTVLLVFLMLGGFSAFPQANLTVQSLVGTHVDTILQHHLVGEGVTITNGKFNNQLGNVQSNQIGTFNRNNFTSFPIATGLVMTTGNVLVAAGPNDASSASSTTGVVAYSESALSNIATNTIEHCASLDFDFQTNSDSFAFRYVFGSEEYCEYVNSEYNDVFAFLLTGPDPVTLVQTTRNVAIIPGSITASNPNGLPVAINNVNHGQHEPEYSGPGTSPSYSQYFIHNSAVNGIQYDGYTVALIARSNVQPCTNYHMKLSVCNLGDNQYDSGVFLEEHSFESAPEPSVTVNSFYCLHDDILFNYDAQNVDSVHIVTPSGDTLWQTPFVIYDALASDSGYYYLRAKRAFSCQGDMWLQDSVKVVIRIPCVAELCSGADICAGETVSYPYAYDSIVGPWVNYVSNNAFTISPPATLAQDTSVLYSLSMYDEYGCYFDTAVTVNFTALANLVIDTVVCDEFLWNGTHYTTSGEYNQTLSQQSGCDSLVTIHFTINHSVTNTDTLVLLENQLPYYYAPADITIALNTPTLSQFVFTLPTYQQCDSTVTMTVIVHYNSEHAADTAVCASELPFVWHGYTFDEAGTMRDTLVAADGSDSVVVLQLTVYPQYETAVEAVVCEGGGFQTGEIAIPAAETVGVDTLARTVTLQSVDGCDSVVNITLTMIDTMLRIVPLTEDFCQEMSAELMVVTPMSDYQWSTGEQMPNITVTLPGVYAVTASQGACRVTAHITIPACDVRLFLPNAITPSRSDGLNDALFIPELAQRFINDFEISVFNRWGEQVFYSADKNFRWNGEVNGKITVNVVYTYVLRYTDANGKPYYLTGTVTVL